VAGTIQILLVDWRQARERRIRLARGEPAEIENEPAVDLAHAGG
jgi:hypothetical protein